MFPSVSVLLAGTLNTDATWPPHHKTEDMSGFCTVRQWCCWLFIFAFPPSHKGKHNLTVFTGCIYLLFYCVSMENINVYQVNHYFWQIYIPILQRPMSVILVRWRQRPGETQSSLARGTGSLPPGLLSQVCRLSTRRTWTRCSFPHKGEFCWWESWSYLTAFWLVCMCFLLQISAELIMMDLSQHLNTVSAQGL